MCEGIWYCYRKERLDVLVMKIQRWVRLKSNVNSDTATWRFWKTRVDWFFFLFYEIIKSHVMHLKIYQIQVAFPPKPRDSMFDITAVYVCSYLLSQVLVVSLGDKTMHREQGNIISINVYFLIDCFELKWSITVFYSLCAQ